MRAWSRVQREERDPAEHATYNIARGHMHFWWELRTYSCLALGYQCLPYKSMCHILSYCFINFPSEKRSWPWRCQICVPRGHFIIHKKNCSRGCDKGAWLNQEPLSLSARLFFLSSPKPFLFLFFGPGFFIDFTQGLLSVLDFSMKLKCAMHKENM